MMIDIDQAGTRLDELVERAAAGETIVFVEAGKPIAKMTAVKPEDADTDTNAIRGGV